MGCDIGPSSPGLEDMKRIIGTHDSKEPRSFQEAPNDHVWTFKNSRRKSEIFRYIIASVGCKILFYNVMIKGEVTLMHWNQFVMPPPQISTDGDSFFNALEPPPPKSAQMEIVSLMHWNQFVMPPPPNQHRWR